MRRLLFLVTHDLSLLYYDAVVCRFTQAGQNTGITAFRPLSIYLPVSILHHSGLRVMTVETGVHQEEVP